MPKWLHNLLLQPSSLMAVGALVVVSMLIIKMPTFLLDFFMVLNITAGMLVMMTVLFLQKASDFYVFPSLLLTTTIFRLGINVSSTRLILTEGNSFDGKLVKAFGEIVIGNNVIVGLVIFIILIIVQFLVITKGASRIAEVAARFSLDKMPGKQMAIDADLNAGIIDEEGAKKRRLDLDQEAEFYGAMDGASKFVSGDVIVGLIITAINIIGGIIVGISINDMGAMDAFQLFGKFAVGDGLVAQIPTLLISTATGMLVTRAGATDNVGNLIRAQLFQDPKVLYIVGGFLIAASLIPGFPMGIMMVSGGLAIFVGIVIQRSESQPEEIAEGGGGEGEEGAKPVDVIPSAVVDTVQLTLGYNLIPLVDQSQGGDLLDRITMTRQQMAESLGFIVPPIRIKDDVELGPDEYCIIIRDVEVSRFTLQANRMLAIPTPGTAVEEIEGTAVIEPAFQQQAVWIAEERREAAESAGYTVVDLPTIVTTHLTEVLRRNASFILGREDTKKLVEHLKERQPALIDEFNNLQGGLGKLQKVLQNLLSEGLSVRDLGSIMERIIDFQSVADPDQLTERVREGLARQISHKYATINGDATSHKISVILIDPDLDMEIAESVTQTEDGMVSTLDSNSIQRLVGVIREETEKVREQNLAAVLLCSGGSRQTLHTILRKFVPNVEVISHQEVADGYETETLGVVTL